MGDQPIVRVTYQFVDITLQSYIYLVVGAESLEDALKKANFQFKAHYSDKTFVSVKMEYLEGQVI